MPDLKSVESVYLMLAFIVHYYNAAPTEEQVNQ